MQSSRETYSIHLTLLTEAPKLLKEIDELLGRISRETAEKYPLLVQIKQTMRNDLYGDD
jgi:hypothetical protein